MPRETFFQRWRVAIAAFVAQALGPGLFAVYGFFVAPLAETFEASHASLAFGMSLLLIIRAALGPILGPILDRHSIRRIMLAGVALVVSGLLLASQAGHLAVLCGGYVVAVLGLTLYAPLPAIVLVSNHYTALRGRALSLAVTGTSVAGMLLPLGAARLLAHSGWRATLVSLALLIGVMSAVTFLVCVPKDSRPSSEAAQGPKDPTPPVDRSWTFLRTRAFWFIGITFSILFGLANFYAFSLAPHLQQIGLPVEDAAWVLSAGATMSLGAKLVFAGVLDRLQKHLIPVTVGLIAIQAGAWLRISTGTELSDFLVAAALFSVSIGPFLSLGPYLNSVYFDEAIIGRVNGAQAPLALPFALAGPPLAGLSFDLTGRYVTAFHVAVAILLLVGTMFLFLGRPERAGTTSRDERVSHGNV